MINEKQGQGTYSNKMDANKLTENTMPKNLPAQIVCLRKKLHWVSVVRALV